MKFFRTATEESWTGTVYHGGADVEYLDPHAAPGSATGNPTAGWGTFFTPDEREAQRYVDDFHGGEGRIHRVEVELRRPYRMSFAEYESFVKLDLSQPTEPQMEENRRRADEFKQNLVEKGYDGIVIGRPGVARPVEIVVFENRSFHAASSKSKSFNRIREEAGRNGPCHHLKLVCDRCGRTETCRCPADKVEMHGICYYCENDTTLEDDIRKFMDERRSSTVRFFRIAQDRLSTADSKYPRAGAQVAGFDVGERIDNTASIGASLYKYEVLPGIREVPMSEFDEYRPYSKDGWDNVKKLMSEIGTSKRIDPLIVVVDAEGPYVLEGGHRLAALQLMKIKKMPALVVVDTEDA